MVTFQLLTSLREPDAQQQISKSRVRVQAVKLRVHFEVCDIAIALSICLFQPGEGLIFLAQARVDGGDVIRRDSRNFSEISRESSACTARMSDSLRLYCSPQMWLLSRASTNSVMIERPSPRGTTRPGDHQYLRLDSSLGCA
jgi:hypothetical protein